MADEVSRETGDATPVRVNAQDVFAPERRALAERYAELLATEGATKGLIGPREVPRLWARHILNCAVVGDLLPPEVSVCDIGSGAGLPGLVLAIARPDLQVTLLEPLLRRSTFLAEVVGELGLEGVEVVRGRAEEWHGRRTFEAVTSRAVAPLDRLLTWSMPLVAPTGAMLAMKGSSVEDEIIRAAPTLRQLRCAAPVVHTLGAPAVDPPTTVVRVVWADPVRVGWRPPPRPPSRRAQRR